jgi:hypothetical protein
MLWHNGKGDKNFGRDAIRDLKLDFDKNHQLLHLPKLR